MTDYLASDEPFLEYLYFCGFTVTVFADQVAVLLTVIGWIIVPMVKIVRPILPNESCLTLPAI
jgi:hypothetical protein